MYPQRSARQEEACPEAPVKWVLSSGRGRSLQTRQREPRPRWDPEQLGNILLPRDIPANAEFHFARATEERSR